MIGVPCFRVSDGMCRVSRARRYLPFTFLLTRDTLPFGPTAGEASFVLVDHGCNVEAISSAPPRGSMTSRGPVYYIAPCSLKPLWLRRREMPFLAVTPCSTAVRFLVLGAPKAAEHKPYMNVPVPQRTGTQFSVDLAPSSAPPPSGSLRLAKPRRGVRKGDSDANCCQMVRSASSEQLSLEVHFSQGRKDYSWLPVPCEPHVSSPCALRGGVPKERVRFFGMPSGYPDTTAAGFQRFFYVAVVTSFVSNFASSIGYQSLLKGFFLESSPQLWMLKDLFPALLAAYFANHVVSYENRPKYWFCVSVFMCNIAVISDMVVPSILPQHLLTAAIITSTLKQSSSLMYFISRAAALQHFSIKNNLADVTKKVNSFCLVSHTIATALGITFCTLVPSFTVQLMTVVLCCAINMHLSTQAMRPIAFRTLNFTSITLILREYIMSNHRNLLTPDDVSSVLGVRMSLSQCDEEYTSLLYISPPVDKLLIRSDTLGEDVLYVSSRDTFMLALWEPSTVPLTIRQCWYRCEIPSFFRYMRRSTSRFRRRQEVNDGKRSPFGGRRLVFLTHSKCPSEDYITAYLIMHTAMLKHSSSDATLRGFIRKCWAERGIWEMEGRKLRGLLQAANWDVDLLALDHPNFRLSSLIVQTSRQAERSPDTIRQCSSSMQ